MLKISKSTAKQTVAVCSVISVVALSACSGGNSASPSANDVGSNPSGTENKTISLSVMTSDRFLELAKQKYEESHPNIKIDIKEYVAAPTPAGAGAGAKGPNGQTAMIVTKPDPKNTEKYVSTVGTELMSGKASDLIVMSELPYKKYADKKLLENIGDLMNNDASFQKGNYYNAIFDAMKYNNALYTVPVKFGLSMWLGNQAVLANEAIDDAHWTWEDFKKIAGKLQTDKSTQDLYPLGKIDSDQLITLMLNSSFSRFVDTGGKKAKFDSPDFINMLKLAKSMYDDKIIAVDNKDNNVVFNPKSNIMMYLDMYSMPKTFFDGKAAYYNLPSLSETKGTTFTTSLPIAINSKSPHKKEAWEFVKFLLSDEMQSAKELNGFAVNKNGAKAQMESLKTLGTGEGGAGKGLRLMVNGKELALQPATEQDIAAIDKVMNNVKVYAESDLKITSIVSEETAPFFQGQKSAEEVAKVIQNKISTYLQE